ncbi:hypothetical protein EYF80_013669 [Liparis tanakae]|uniref:Uncharacterized protein n=1 Tax=Liparis tanakae TaxID=230148 RepID=A0A4Z2IDQ7_9TELE|nr:hypothetical protein EYF80_013669 [Liparis tanakae]
MSIIRRVHVCSGPHAHVDQIPQHKAVCMRVDVSAHQKHTKQTVRSQAKTIVAPSFIFKPAKPDVLEAHSVLQALSKDKNIAEEEQVSLVGLPALCDLNTLVQQQLSVLTCEAEDKWTLLHGDPTGGLLLSEGRGHTRVLSTWMAGEHQFRSMPVARWHADGLVTDQDQDTKDQGDSSCTTKLFKYQSGFIGAFSL